MRSIYLMVTLLLSSLLSPLFASIVVSQVLYRADGVTTRNGTVTISWTTFVSADGHRNAAGSFTTRVTNGVFSVTLEPNDTSTPSTQYKVLYRLDGGPSPDTFEYWSCPTSGSPMLISACVTTPLPPGGGQLSLSQIAQGGATTGQCLTWSVTTWAPASGCWIVIGNDLYNPNSRTVIVGGSSTAAAGAYKLEVQKSGTSATARFMDLTAVTGFTTVLFQAGAGQASNALALFKSNAGTDMSYIASDGGFVTKASAKAKIIVSQSIIRRASDVVDQWNSTDDLAGGSIDLGAYRNGAGILEINNGTVNSYRDLKIRILYATSGTEPTCNSGNRGALVLTVGGAGVADTFRVCTKDGATDAYAYRSLF